MLIEGRVWTFGHDISTDLLYPQSAYRLPVDEAATLVFEANRPGWSTLMRPGDIVVGGRNFGMGSGRPAPALLRRLGVAACLAESVGALFLRSCINFALPAMTCPGILGIVEEGHTIRIDLARGHVENLDTGAALACHPLPAELLSIIDEGGLISSLERRGLIGPEPVPDAETSGARA